ncbi:nickel-responsive transcriptional regulator NikR [Magnetococcales bacterium HHB-1]
MKRITISLEDDLLQELEDFMDREGYDNRSEVFRDLLRDRLGAKQEGEETQPGIGCLTYIYDHERRELSSRLTRTQHHHHAISLATLHVHLNHDACLEANILKGNVEEMQNVARAIVSQPGVRHGHLHVIPNDASEKSKD